MFTDLRIFLTVKQNEHTRGSDAAEITQNSWVNFGCIWPWGPQKFSSVHDFWRCMEQWLLLSMQLMNGEDFQHVCKPKTDTCTNHVTEQLFSNPVS